MSGPGEHRPGGAATSGTAGSGTGRQLVAEIASVVASEEEARRIVAQSLGVSVAVLSAHLGQGVSEPAADAARSMSARRAGGEPLQHVLGTWGFRTLDVLVDGRALVPRPETEQVVEAALGELSSMTAPSAPGASASLVAVDVGTGSGVIALALAAEGPPGLEAWAVDRSDGALELARSNLQRLAGSDPGAAARVHLALGSWFEPLPLELVGHVQLVVSNPPYVSAAEWETLDPVVRQHDPHEALVSGPAGTEALSLVLDQARRWLAPGGSLVLELAPHQADAVRAEAEGRGYASVEIRPDLAGRDRILLARRSGPRP